MCRMHTVSHLKQEITQFRLMSEGLFDHPSHRSASSAWNDGDQPESTETGLKLISPTSVLKDTLSQGKDFGKVESQEISTFSR